MEQISYILIGFLIARLSTYLDKFFERQVKSYNELVYLQGYFNTCVAITHDNLNALNDFILTIRSGSIYVNSIQMYPVYEDYSLRLASLEYLNKTSSTIYQLKRVNNDIARIDLQYKDLVKYFLQKDIDPQTYMANVVDLSPQLQEFSQHLIRLKGELISRLAEARLLSKKERTPFSILYEKIYSITTKSLNKADIDKEKEIVLKGFQ